MRLKKINITGFRLLHDVAVCFDEVATVVVGRNNSGKTSLTELFRRVFTDRTVHFSLEDFSLCSYEQLYDAWQKHLAGVADEGVRVLLPTITARLTIAYEKTEDLGLLSEFIVDLNPDCTEAMVVVRYALDDAGVSALFQEIEVTGDAAKDRDAFYKVMQVRVPRTYRAELRAEDPNDPSNSTTIEWKRLSALIRVEFIGAQRGLDDVTSKENDVLGRILSNLFETASSSAADPADQNVAQNLEVAIQGIQDDLGTKFNKELDALLPTFALFGYPSLPDPKLLTQTNFDVARLLSNHTRILYPGANGIHLPETYNGLGARNLIFILLKLHAFYKGYKAAQPSPGIHFVFIEEPEAHLHPQMQEVFIEKLASIRTEFARGGTPWPAQFMVTTHSSHVANRAAFKAIRYFMVKAHDAQPDRFRAVVKDLQDGFDGSLKDDEDFLHKYMTLTRCDLLFADKIILIEGTSERLLLPKMVEKLEQAAPEKPRLSTQYVSVIEVGGAYAHLFFRLLGFLELPALIITDLDSIGDDRRACKASEGTGTSNACIKTWFSDPSIAPSALIAKTADEKAKDSRRIAFQIPEETGRPCGRSFEQAFILANPAVFGFAESAAATEDATWQVAMDQKKSSFALEHAIYKPEWTVPRYILEGLEWLAAYVQPVSPDASGGTTAPAEPAKNMRQDP